MIKKFSNAPREIFNKPEYASYIVEYQGDLEKEASLSKDFYITIINDKYAAITVAFENIFKGSLTIENNPFPSVVYIGRNYPYSLQGSIKPWAIDTNVGISPLITSNIASFHTNVPLKLTGKGTVVAILDTGVDYLSTEFRKSDGTTRILSIWDQTIEEGKENNVPFGTEFNRDEINAAIKASEEGKSPYEIVNTKDEVGHGTAMAGVIGARGVNSDIGGGAPECEFLVIKLKEGLMVEKLFNDKEYIFDAVGIMLALQYAFEYAVSFNVPMIIYMPLGTTFGNHKKNGLMENFVDNICNNTRIAIINGTGDEADAGNHYTGSLSSTGEFNDIEIYVSEDQKNLSLELWSYVPNRVLISIISPSGETTGKIPALSKQQQITKFIFEKSTSVVQYYLPEDLSGDELISLTLLDLQPGIWTIRVYGEYVLDGAYDVWMLPKQLLNEGTHFSSPNNYGSITTPSTSRYTISVAEYNQNNYNVVRSSGMYFQNSKFILLDITAGGVNVKTIAPGNKYAVANGTGVSAAVVTGASALMFQWGIVQGNAPSLYAQTLKSFLLTGTNKRENDIYPNPQWGYGILDLVEVFRNIE